MPHMPPSVLEDNLYAEMNERIAALEASVGGGVSEVIEGSVSLLSVNALAYATGNGSTDDRAALQLAIAAAKSSAVKTLYLPPASYRISKYLEVTGGDSLRIAGPGARILYPSDDASVGPDSVASTNQIARSAIFARYCSNLSIEGITFVGGTNADITINLGKALYATHCVGTTLSNCDQVDGAGIVIQDALSDTNGTGDSLTFDATTGYVTITDAAGVFQEGHGSTSRRATINNATNVANCGTFPIVSRPSSTTLVIYNPAGVTETSSFRWSIDDGDRTLRIFGGVSSNVRGASVPTHDTVVVGHTVRQPDTADLTGLGSLLTVVGTTVTLSTYSWKPSTKLIGKYVTIAGASTPHNGVFKVTAVTAKSNQYNAASITYTNTNVGIATEAFTGSWWVVNGEKTGVGAGVGALAKAGTTMTLTADVASFHATDVGKNIRVHGATTSANDGLRTITTYVSPTQVQYVNSAGVAEDFTGQWSIDSFDRVGGSSSGVGSSHGFYVFAGRSGVKFIGCRFENIRESALKGSGSSEAISDYAIIGCSFYQCANALTFGADDSQDHTNLIVTGCTFVDCSMNRAGWFSGKVIDVLGARSVSIYRNKVYYTQNSIGSVNGDGVGSNIGFAVARYSTGISQPLEAVCIDKNEFTADPTQTTLAGLLTTALRVQYVGQRAYWATAGTLTKSGDTMTLTHSAASFSSLLVGRSITFVNTPGGANDGTFVVETVPSSPSPAKQLTFTNAAGTHNTSAGTYRIGADRQLGTHTNSNHRGTGCSITGNTIEHVAATAVSTFHCFAPRIVANDIGTGTIVCNGDVEPYIDENRGTSASTDQAHIRLTSVSWPLVGNRNHLVNPHHTSTHAATRGMSVGVGSTVSDFPLLGFRGRAKATNAYEEVVVAYGVDHVDGDIIAVTLSGVEVIYTYKAVGPVGNEFNSFAGLVALINAQANIDCADYGAQFSTPVTTNHLHIRRTAQSASDAGTLTVRTSALNPTALVLLRNRTSGGTTPQCWGRGAGAAGPVPDKVVAWSPLLHHTSVANLVAGNTTARTILAGSFLQVRNVDDGGCCALFQTGNRTDNGDGVTDLGGEFRWSVAS